MRLLHTSTVVASLIALGACAGESEPVPEPDPLPPKDVPSSPDTLKSSEVCTPLRDGERLVSVSPEGHAWLVVAGDTTSLRVLDAFGPELTEELHELELADVGDVRAWSAGDAALTAGDGLWRLDALARIALTPPDGFALPASFCGSPSENGMVVSDGSVFELRADGQWWAWKPEVEPQAVVAIDGECQTRENFVWLLGADGSLFRVGASQLALARSFDGLVDAAATHEQMYALDASGLWAGGEAWQAWRFLGEKPTQLSAAASFVWMASGAQLLRFDGETFLEIEHGLAAIDQVAAHADGAWIVGDGQVCHESTGPSVRLDGVRPNQRLTTDAVAFDLVSSDPSATLALTVDGAEQPLLPTDGAAMHVDLTLAEVGWHELVIVAKSAAGDARRSVLVKRVPEIERSWVTDIQPIYQASCATSGCHGSTDAKAPDLGTANAWRAIAPAIRTRVVDAQTMPPAANVGPDWGDEQIQAIAQWLEGGMLP